MCIIAAQMRGSAPLASDIFLQCWKENPHGAGYMFCHEGNVVIRKAFFTLPELEDSYRADHAMHGQSSPFVLHFRWATHGSKNELNTHPHPVLTGEVAMVHNGVLKVDIPKGEDISDTVAYIREQLSWRTPKQLLGGKMRRHLGADIGFQNKFVLLRGDGEWSIVNEREGEWDGDCWYSNTGYRPHVVRYFVPHGTGNGARYGQSLWDDQSLVHPSLAWEDNHTAVSIPPAGEGLLGELWEELQELEGTAWDELTEEQWKRRLLLEEVLYSMDEQEHERMTDEYDRYLLRDC